MTGNQTLLMELGCVKANYPHLSGTTRLVAFGQDEGMTLPPYLLCLV